MSNINRYNYETYFLLYVDNELSAVEKNSVDEFVQSNPDLGEELVMLLQTILQKDGILLNNKMSLYKKETLSSDLQSKLLLHLDNELNEVEKNEVSALIASSTTVSEEWEKIQSAKFFPESTIVYEDKKSLYRTEKGKLVFLPWRKLLAAAILVGVGLWEGLVYLNSSSNISKQVIPNTENKFIAGEIKKNSSTNTNQIKKLPSQHSKRITSTRPSGLADYLSNFSVSKIEKKTIPSAESETEEMPNLSNSHSKLVDLINMVNNEGETSSISNDGEMLEKKLVERSKELGLKLVDDQQIIEQTLLTNNSNTEDSSENNNQIFLIGEEKLKRIMSGGFFAKVKKSLERRSLNQNIHNSIKVANFEITLR
jgi:hypothetical protein